MTDHPHITTCPGCGRDLTSKGAVRLEHGRRIYTHRHGWHTSHRRTCTNCLTMLSWDTGDEWNDGPGRPPSNVDDLRRYAQESGSHFFDQETMRFFGSRLSGDVVPVGLRVYFITSEQDKPRGEFPPAWDGARRYTVRYMTPGANFFEIANDDGEKFGAFTTLRAARAALKKAIR